MRCIDAVIFDFGGVLTGPIPEVFTSHHDPMLRELLVGDYGAIGSMHPWHRLERGEIRLREYQRLVFLRAEELGMSTPDVALLSPGALAAMEPRLPMLDLAQRLRTNGVRTAILTNNVVEFRAWRDLVDAENLVDVIVDSCLVGMRKPDARIFELTVSLLGTDAARTCFIDDMQVNTVGARRAGLVAMHLGSPEDAHAIVRAVEVMTETRRCRSLSVAAGL